ncbi:MULTISPECIES: thiocillin/thiostrepton family thiazolyl peptide [Bacillus]|uniref:thiocillin/thiostrepton family thiazolyl peptide n=1 Tax=Bacillus TaxID=1386 RepID=UPI0012F24A4E|nr:MULTISPECIES: thiocillin/thiostrepton family thiazolyl peptide [Bacillus]MBI1630690.1 thiocillin/thiostrepton family thiazolyl peptide [Bacillus safensis]MCY7454010.1 thiocillin/thiostrepton family thiazolyl peptide [Bacillus altitudinis]MDG3044772.1 thiocillin/thiostrepton family thiazolyl peptide [Bacillus sp. B6(2022)]VXC34332.1 Thiocillin [Bacillus altitudinis]
MTNLKKALNSIEIEELDVTEMVDAEAMSEEDATQIMGASCTTCVCTCSCCTT